MIVTTDQPSLTVPTSVRLPTDGTPRRTEVHRISTVQEIRKYPVITITVETVVTSKPVRRQALSKIVPVPANLLMTVAVPATMEIKARSGRTTDHRSAPIPLKEIPANPEVAEGLMKTPEAVKDQNAAVVLQDNFRPKEKAPP